MDTHNTDTLDLPTLHTQPTWHNRFGRIDRSACFTVSTNKLWRLINDRHWTYRYPARQPAYHAKGKCDRHAGLYITSRFLWLLHKFEEPRPLQGCHRTPKSNAMKCLFNGRPLPSTPTHPQNPSHKPKHEIPYHEPINPNRGAGFKMHKMLGLNCMWDATLSIERYVQHHNLKQHFLVCPVCSGGTGFQPVVKRSNDDRQDACPTKKLPTGRVTKLYLPLCTEREYEDAQVAQLWLKTNAQPNRPWTPQALQLIERYGELFDDSVGRQLRCRQCLGLRFGEVKAHQPAHAYPPRHPFTIALEQTNPRPIVTEQALFLSNLPKLLAKPQFMQAEPVLPKPVEAMSAAEKEKLLMRFASSLPSFKILNRVRQMLR